MQRFANLFKQGMRNGQSSLKANIPLARSMASFSTSPFSKTAMPVFPKTMNFINKQGQVHTIPVRFVRIPRDAEDRDHSHPEEEEKRNPGETYEARQEKKNRDMLYYLFALGFTALGVSYLAVPLYAAFCQVMGIGGTVQREQQVNELNNYMKRTEHIGADDAPMRPVQVIFEATVHPSLNWSFEPCQREITLRIGETALAFYKAKNNMDRPFIGISTYNVLPPQAGIYFNKIQCFCFDEQRLRAGEEMDMPIFFFLDPAMADDWRMDGVDQVTLSYTFFPSSEDEESSDILALNKAIRSPSELSPAQLAAAQKALAEAKANLSAKANATAAATSASGTGVATPLNDAIAKNPTLDALLNKDLPKGRNLAEGKGELVCPPMPPAQHNPTGKQA